MNTLIANLKHAARNRETTTIGGGEFSPEELNAAVAEIEALGQQKETLNRHAAALQEIADMLETLPEAKKGNTKIHYCLAQARNALQGER